MVAVTGLLDLHAASRREQWRFTLLHEHGLHVMREAGCLNMPPRGQYIRHNYDGSMSYDGV